MKGFDYVTGQPVNWSLSQWRKLAHGVVRNGGFVTEDRALKETFIHRMKRYRSEIVAEIYAINLDVVPNHKETSGGR